MSSRKAIAPGGAAGLQTRLGTASVPGQVRLRLPSAISINSTYMAGRERCVAYTDIWLKPKPVGVSLLAITVYQ